MGRDGKKKDSKLNPGGGRAITFEHTLMRLCLNVRMGRSMGDSVSPPIISNREGADS